MAPQALSIKNRLLSSLSDPKIILITWILIGIIFGLQGLITYRYNNYLIFKYTFPHLIKQLPLYVRYPHQYGDSSHYGPLFSIFIAPFYFLPDWLGLPLWNIFNVVVLWWAIRLLPIKEKTNVLIGWLAIPGLIASTLSEQFNPLAGAFIILSYLLIRREKECWSAFFIVLGTAIKLYGIVGLVFFFFSIKKKHFIGYLLVWSVVLFLLPMLFSSPAYVVDSYIQWAHSLAHKNLINAALTSTQDVSIMGIVRRLSLNQKIPDMPFLIAGAILFFTAFLYKSKYHKLWFQLAVLSLVLITPVIFSSSSEDVTYIIAITGAGIWFVMSKDTLWRNLIFAMLLFVLLVPLWTILPEDMLNHYPFLYIIKAVPYSLIWISILYGIHFRRQDSMSYFGMNS